MIDFVFSAWLLESKVSVAIEQS